VGRVSESEYVRFECECVPFECECVGLECECVAFECELASVTVSWVVVPRNGGMSVQRNRIVSQPLQPL
jgi:hypothetical protein